jgi:hypothetical protein
VARNLSDSEVAIAREDSFVVTARIPLYASGVAVALITAFIS